MARGATTFNDDPRRTTFDLPPEVEIVGARLDRCVDHFEAFRVAWEDHLATDPHEVSVDVDDAGRGRMVFTRRREPPAQHLLLILGEFLYELRTALDNALCAVAINRLGSESTTEGDRAGMARLRG